MAHLVTRLVTSLVASLARWERETFERQDWVKEKLEEISPNVVKVEN